MKPNTKVQRSYTSAFQPKSNLRSLQPTLKRKQRNALKRVGTPGCSAEGLHDKGESAYKQAASERPALQAMLEYLRHNKRKSPTLSLLTFHGWPGESKTKLPFSRPSAKVV